MAIRNLTQRNAMATAYGAAAPYGALFTADPGTADNATGEVSGGSPAYARKAMSWGAAAASAITGAPVFDVPASTTVSWPLLRLLCSRWVSCLPSPRLRRRLRQSALGRCPTRR